MNPARWRIRCSSGFSLRRIPPTLLLRLTFGGSPSAISRRRKSPSARVVLDRLATTELGARDLKIPANEVESWLRTLTSVRLAVATRLGIRDAAAADELAALPDDDPRSFMVSVYDWLGFAQETLIAAL